MLTTAPIHDIWLLVSENEATSKMISDTTNSELSFNRGDGVIHVMGNPSQHIQVRAMKLTPKHSPVGPPITEPNLADSIEQMFVRRANGLQTPLPSFTRTYPVDPLGLTEAKTMVSDRLSKLGKQKDEISAQIAAKQNPIL